MRQFVTILLTLFVMAFWINNAQARCSFSVGFGGPIGYFPPPPPPRVVYVPVRYYAPPPAYVYYEPAPYWYNDCYAPVYYYPQPSLYFGYAGGISHCGGHRHWRHCR